VVEWAFCFGLHGCFSLRRLGWIQWESRGRASINYRRGAW